MLNWIIQHFMPFSLKIDMEEIRIVPRLQDPITILE